MSQDRGLGWAFVAVIIISGLAGVLMAVGTKKYSTPNKAEAMTTKICADLALAAGYEYRFTSDGTCWFKMEHDITVPYSVALDLLKFKYEAAETVKLNRVEELRQNLAYEKGARK